VQGKKFKREKVGATRGGIECVSFSISCRTCARRQSIYITCECVLGVLDKDARCSLLFIMIHCRKNENVVSKGGFLNSHCQIVPNSVVKLSQ